MYGLHRAAVAILTTSHPLSMDDIFKLQCYRHVIDSAEILEMSWIEVIVNVGTELLTYWNSQVNI